MQYVHLTCHSFRVSYLDRVYYKMQCYASWGFSSYLSDAKAFRIEIDVRAFDKFVGKRLSHFKLLQYSCILECVYYTAAMFEVPSETHEIRSHIRGLNEEEHRRKQILIQMSV